MAVAPGVPDDRGSAHGGTHRAYPSSALGDRPSGGVPPVSARGVACPPAAAPPGAGGTLPARGMRRPAPGGRRGWGSAHTTRSVLGLGGRCGARRGSHPSPRRPVLGQGAGGGVPAQRADMPASGVPRGACTLAASPGSPGNPCPRTERWSSSPLPGATERAGPPTGGERHTTPGGDSAGRALGHPNTRPRARGPPGRSSRIPCGAMLSRRPEGHARVRRSATARGHRGGSAGRERAAGSGTPRDSRAAASYGGPGARSQGGEGGQAGTRRASRTAASCGGRGPHHRRSRAAGPSRRVTAGAGDREWHAA